MKCIVPRFEFYYLGNKISFRIYILRQLFFNERKEYKIDNLDIEFAQACYPEIVVRKNNNRIEYLKCYLIGSDKEKYSRYLNISECEKKILFPLYKGFKQLDFDLSEGRNIPESPFTLLVNKNRHYKSPTKLFNKNHFEEFNIDESEEYAKKLFDFLLN